MHNLKSHFPRIGARIVKSAFAVGLCLFIYQLFGRDEIPFFLVIAALQGLQPYQREVKEVAVRNVIGTLIGAGCSLLILIIEIFVLRPMGASEFWFSFFITIGVAVALYSAVVLGHGESAYFSAVVYLCIIMVHLDNQSPFGYVFQRLFETLCGIGIGMAVNEIHVPRRKVKDTLFVAALDDVLHSESSILPEYSKVELNRLLDDGVRLSVITQHSSASFWQAAGSIRFKMPVILLDGAVMYNPEEKRYLSKKELTHGEAVRIMKVLDDPELALLQSAIIDNSVLVFHQHIPEHLRAVNEDMRLTPYRNYLNLPFPDNLNPVYIFCMGTEEKLDEACDKLREHGIYDQYKIMRYSFQNHPGLGYLRIFSKDADRQKMLEELRRVCGIDKLLTFGNDPDIYDVCVRAAEGESILKAIKDKAEPFIWW